MKWPWQRRTEMVDLGDGAQAVASTVNPQMLRLFAARRVAAANDLVEQRQAKLQATVVDRDRLGSVDAQLTEFAARRVRHAAADVAAAEIMLRIATEHRDRLLDAAARLETTGEPADCA